MTSATGDNHDENEDEDDEEDPVTKANPNSLFVPQRSLQTSGKQKDKTGRSDSESGRSNTSQWPPASENQSLSQAVAGMQSLIAATTSRATQTADETETEMPSVLPKASAHDQQSIRVVNRTKRKVNHRR